MTYSTEYAKAYYLENRERLLAAARSRSLANKPAKAEYDRKRRVENVEEIRAYDRERYYVSRKWDKTEVLRRAKQRAKKKDLECTITVEDFDIPETCPVLGLPMCVAFGQGGKDTSPSLDRIDNTLGYVKGNVWVISARANRIKGAATFAEIESLYRSMLRFQIDDPG